jgi:hypothetical protein
MADIQYKREQWKREQARLRGMLRKVDDANLQKNLKYVGGVGIFEAVMARVWVRVGACRCV